MAGTRRLTWCAVCVQLLQCWDLPGNAAHQGAPKAAGQACTAATCTMMSIMQPHETEAAPSLQIFVDQPINTGFSFSNDSRDRVYDETVVSTEQLLKAKHVLLCTHSRPSS